MMAEGARYKTLAPHYLDGDKYVEAGIEVGDGTQYPVSQPTIEMEPLNDAAREAIEKEEKRLATTGGSMQPEDQLPRTVGERDDYEDRYVPGFNTKRPEKK